MSHHGPQPTASPSVDRLVEADRLVLAELHLDRLLPRVADAARHLLDADHAALCVLRRDGSVERVVEPETSSAPVCADPESHPLTAWLGGPPIAPDPTDAACCSDTSAGGARPLAVLTVPVRVGGGTWAHLYVTNHAGAAPFRGEDEQLLNAFADSAAIAVANALEYDEVRRRRDWSEASAEVGQQLLASASDVRVLEQIADSVARLAEADTVQVVLPVPDLQDTFEFAVSRGPGAEQARGLRYPARGSIAEEAMQHPEGMVLDDVQERLRRYGDARAVLPITNLMAFPLQGEGRPRGSVVVCRSDHRPFSAAEVEMARVFTNQAALALELADARADQSRLGLLEDRERISRDLQHDVLQRLFDTGLTLQAAVALTTAPALRTQLSRAITSLDETIRSIRASVFELPSERVMLTSVASRVVAMVAQLTPPSGPGPELQLSGTLGATVDQALAADLKAVLRLTLDTLARRGRVHTATVHLHADPAEISLSVAVAEDLLSEDDLDGLPPGLRQRAQERGGDLELVRRPDGAQLRFTVPVGAGPATG